MSVGSAASLRLPQVPLSPLVPTRQSVSVPEIPGATAPPRLLSLHKAADPPRGRVLVASQTPTAALEVQRLLCGLGYRVVGPAGSPDEAKRLLDRCARRGGRVDCALVEWDLPDAAFLAGQLADEEIPFLWLAPDIAAVPPPGYANTPVLRPPFDGRALLAAVDEARRQAAGNRLYSLPPPQPVWPRVFPQL
jgi:hypothetical protein